MFMQLFCSCDIFTSGRVKFYIFNYNYIFKYNRLKGAYILAKK